MAGKATTVKEAEAQESAVTVSAAGSGKQAEVKKEEKKEEKAPAKKEAKTVAKKTAAKKTTTTAARKTTAKKAEEKPVEEETMKEETKKEAAQDSAKEAKRSIHLQFGGKSYSMEDLHKIAEDVWKFDLHNEEAYTSLELYVKPEESVAYYVFNGEISGSFFI